MKKTFYIKNSILGVEAYEGIEGKVSMNGNLIVLEYDEDTILYGDTFFPIFVEEYKAWTGIKNGSLLFSTERAKEIKSMITLYMRNCIMLNLDLFFRLHGPEIFGSLEPEGPSIA